MDMSYRWRLFWNWRDTRMVWRYKNGVKLPKYDDITISRQSWRRGRWDKVKENYGHEMLEKITLFKF